MTVEELELKVKELEEANTKAKEKYDSEINSIKEKYDSEIDDLKDKNEKLKKDLSEANDNLVSMRLSKESDKSKFDELFGGMV